MQEVYLEAWKSFHRFEPGTNCRAWLFKILFHRLHHFRRRWAKAAKVEAFENSADQDSLVAETPVPQEIRDEDVLRALATCPLNSAKSCRWPTCRSSRKRDRGNHEAAAGNRDVAAEPGRKLLRQELAGVADTFGITPAKDPPRAGESA